MEEELTPKKHNLSSFGAHAKLKIKTRFENNASPINFVKTVGFTPSLKSRERMIPLQREKSVDMILKEEPSFPKLNSKSSSGQKFRMRPSSMHSEKKKRIRSINTRYQPNKATQLEELKEVTSKKNSRKTKKLKILKIARRGSEAMSKMLYNTKPPLPRKPKFDRELENKRVLQPTVSFLGSRKTSINQSVIPFKQPTTQSFLKSSLRRNISVVSDLKSVMGVKNKMGATIRSKSQSRMTILVKPKPIDKKEEEKRKLITKLLSKNSDDVDPDSIIFSIPNSVIMKSKQWSLSNDKLAEINQAVISECNLLLNSKTGTSRRKGMDEAIKSYIERDLIQKLKQNTWNWIVANKREYVNFMATNYDKFKKWLINRKIKPTSTVKLQMNGKGQNDRQTINEEELAFTKKTFNKMMNSFGLGKDKETLD
ncbi:unnamed protein product [Moneuplotes crassus]|uniref:Uncharacterized protein n=1 Tax=Euplotes crassus TaxID=5936 RepID=A0AAD1UAT4_EUPCR|nr:unnamed protein product [Moneuplotes crassus]